MKKIIVYAIYARKPEDKPYMEEFVTETESKDKAEKISKIVSSKGYLSRIATYDMTNPVPDFTNVLNI